MSNPNNPKSIFTPEFAGPTVGSGEINSSRTGIASRDPEERADAIIRVYRNLGIYGKEHEKSERERILPDVTALTEEYDKNQGIQSIPFVVVNLATNSALTTLISAFDNKLPNTSSKTFVFSDLWDQYTATDINCRTVKGGREPVVQSVRAHILTQPENHHEEPGLELVRSNGMKLTEQRKQAEKLEASGKNLLNLTDYVILQALIADGEGLSPLDRQTVTRFPQLPEKYIRGGSCVGGAYWSRDGLYLDGSYGLAGSGCGVRSSVGPKAQTLKS